MIHDVGRDRIPDEDARTSRRFEWSVLSCDAHGLCRKVARALTASEPPVEFTKRFRRTR
ncbi:MAG: hypothetical protein ABL934_14670 [Lysobacteraceae bacterium]